MLLSLTVLSGVEVEDGGVVLVSLALGVGVGVGGGSLGNRYLGKRPRCRGGGGGEALTGGKGTGRLRPRRGSSRQSILIVIC